MVRWLLPLLPVLCLVLLWSALRPLAAGRRERLLAAAAALGVWIVLVSEGLSLAGALTAPAVRLSWALLAAALAVLAARVRARPAASPEPSASPGVLGGAVLAAAAVLLLALLAGALFAAPNTYDSMTYHMTRVVRWIQQGSLEHFPSHNLRQVQYGYFAEAAVLHLFLLRGSDRLANLPQWLSLAGSLAGVSLLAARLGAARGGQILAAVFCLTLPMGIVQATGTQNDLVTAFWAICMAWAVLRRGDASTPGARRLWDLVFGAALGLAVLTKATGYLYAAPFAVWYLAALVRREGRSAWRVAVPVLLLAAALNLGLWWRNFALFGSPLGTESNRVLVSNRAWWPGLVLSNAVRNLAVHANVAVPGGADPRPSVEAAVRRLHAWIGVDVEDPRSTYERSPTFRIVTRPFHEDDAGNGFHLLVLLAALPLLAARRSGEARGLLAYGIAVLAGFLLLCLYLKWQHWISRLQLPLFVLAAPLVAVAVSTRLGRRPALLLSAFLLGMAWPPSAHADPRPLVGPASVFRADRTGQMFRNRPERLQPYQDLAARIQASGCRRIGLVTDYNDYEYPLWILLDRGAERRFRIEHVEVENESAPLLKREPFRGFRPCLTASLRASKIGLLR